MNLKQWAAWSCIMLLPAGQVMAETNQEADVKTATSQASKDITAPFKNAGVPAVVISLQDSWISAEIAANIEAINTDVGDTVKRGAVLARLDCREFILREEQAKADLASLKAQLPAINAKTHLASIELKRARDLVKRKLVAQQELDSADSNYRMAEAERPALNAQINAALAKLKTEQLQVARCSLKAPFSGEIAERKIQLGQRIGIGEEALRIISNDDREISASLSAAEFKQVKQAKTLHFTTPEAKHTIRFRAAVGVVSGDARTREARFMFTKKTGLAIGVSGRITWEGK